MNAFKYLYICMYVYMYVLDIYIYIYIYVCIYVCIRYIYIYIYMYVYMYVLRSWIDCIFLVVNIMHSCVPLSGFWYTENIPPFLFSFRVFLLYLLTSAFISLPSFLSVFFFSLSKRFFPPLLPTLSFSLSLSLYIYIYIYIYISSLVTRGFSIVPLPLFQSFKPKITRLLNSVTSNFWLASTVAQWWESLSYKPTLIFSGY